MPPHRSPGSDDDAFYEAFYGFHEPPFATTTDPRFFYLSTSHRHAYTELVNGLRRREGLLMITGETGTGKTTLCRAVIAGLGERTFSAIIVNPYMTGAEVLRMIVRDLGLVSRTDLRRGSLATADVPQLLDTLEGFLTSIVPIDGRAVLVLDEAQSVAPAVLDQIRVLSNLEHQGSRLIDIILSGQPRLVDTIRSRPLAALDERITRRVTLEPLGPADIPSYIQHRLRVAGDAPSVRFDAAAMQAIADLSRGLPRRVNVLCDRALQLGRLEAAATITAPLIRGAEETLGNVHTQPLAEAPPFGATADAPYLSGDEPADIVVPPPVADEVEPEAPEAGAGLEPTAESEPAPESFIVHEPPALVGQTSAVSVARPEHRSGFGPATVHPPVPKGGTRPDLAPPPSIREPTSRAEPEAPVETPLIVEPASAADSPESAEPIVQVESAPSEPARQAAEAPAVKTRQKSGFGPATVHPPVPKGGTRPDLAPPPSDQVVRHRPAEASTTADTVVIAAPAITAPTTAADRAITASGHDTDAAADTPGDPFGRSEDEAAARAAWIKRGGVAAAVVLALAVAYLGWAWDVRDSATLVGPAPGAPALDRGTPTGPHPVPPPDELEARFNIRLRPWRPLPETPSNAAPPPQLQPSQLLRPPQLMQLPQ